MAGPSRPTFRHGLRFLTTGSRRGHPRIHVCQERVQGIPIVVVRGAVHHEISHALHHGTPEFYTFRFSSRLIEAARSCALDLPLLQQLVYFLAIAINFNTHKVFIKFLAHSTILKCIFIKFHFKSYFRFMVIEFNFRSVR